MAFLAQAVPWAECHASFFHISKGGPSWTSFCSFPNPFFDILGLYGTGSMASVFELYNQVDFVPPAKLAEWHASGDTVGAIMEWLLIPTDVGNALLAEIDVPASDHVSAISSIAPSEWEEVIARPAIREVPVSLGMRGRLRQVLLSARISVGVIKPAPAVVDAGGLKQLPPKPDSTSDGLTTVNLCDVIIQGTKPIEAPLISRDEYRKGLQQYEETESIECPTRSQTYY